MGVKSALFLNLAEVVELHRLLIGRFGGTEILRDRGLLESALARPRSGYYESLSQQAAALLQSIALNHAFLDGNNCVAFASAAIFLDMNGYRLEVDNDEGETFMVKHVIAERIDLEQITQWLEKRMRPI